MRLAGNRREVKTMQGRIPWMMSFVMLLGTAPVWAAETIVPVSMTPSDVRTQSARPADDEPTPTSARGATSIMSLPSLQTIQAVVNGRRLVPGR
jgi:hypothetical protein